MFCSDGYPHLQDPPNVDVDVEIRQNKGEW